MVKITYWSEIGIILISFIVFILFPHSLNLLSFSGFLFLKGDIWRIFTFMFTHLDWSHLFENSVALIFISLLAVESELSERNFFSLFVVGSILLALSSIIIYPNLFITGASAGVFTVLGSLSYRGIKFIPQYVFIPLLASPIFVKVIVSIINESYSTEILSQGILHLLSFIYGIVLLKIIVYYINKKPKKILSIGY